MHESRVLNANIELVRRAFKQFNDMKRLNDMPFKAKGMHCCLQWINCKLCKKIVFVGRK